ncbi:hypothetical protein AWB71_06089 [Caballeronia peredens]|nr:hypothetical protein AWB71_06089 [Caballeronia peredens]
MSSSATGATLRLPVGLFHERARHGTARLRLLAGTDELRVQEAAAAGEPRASLVTALLAACTTAIGDLADIDESLVQALCIGDREALLLHLHRLTFGEAIEAVVSCPGCAELLDLDLRVADLLVPPAMPGEPEAVVAVGAAGASWRARLRRVTGADQLAVLYRSDAAAQLLRQCILSLERDDGTAWPLESIPQELAAALDGTLAELDPQAEIRLALACPACRQNFTANFDAAGHLIAEIAAEAGLLLGEVGAIARAFRWRETDILALPRPRRRAYAALAAQR